MRRIASAAALAVLVAVAAVVPAARADEFDPIALQVKAPAVVTAGKSFAVTVGVRADAGALDPAAAPLRIRVKLAAGECGGSYKGTAGRRVIDTVLTPRPVPRSSYATASAGRATGRARLSGSGAWTVCAFLEDGEQRQFATDVDSIVEVKRAHPPRTRRGR